MSQKFLITFDDVYITSRKCLINIVTTSMMIYKCSEKKIKTSKLKQQPTKTFIVTPLESLGTFDHNGLVLVGFLY